MIYTTQELFEKAKEIKYADSKMVCIPIEQKPIGFFPAGSGFWDGKEALLSDKDVLILGQDFSNEEAFKCFEKDPEKSEDTDANPTWKNLITLLKDLEIPLEKCFFSNVYMGLRKGSSKNSGPCPGIRNNLYKESCEEFLKTQIEAVSPSIIIIMGFEPLKAMRRVFPKEIEKWKVVKTVKEVVTSDDKQVVTTNINDKEVKIVFVIHPSLNGTNRSKIFGKKDIHKEVENLKKLL